MIALRAPNDSLIPARALSLDWLRSSTGWDGAISAYSAWPLIGAIDLQKVRTVLASITAHPRGDQQDPALVYWALLSPQAYVVRIVTPADPLSAQSGGLPHVTTSEPPDLHDQKSAAIQRLQPSVTNLPQVTTPTGAASWSLAPLGGLLAPAPN